MPTNVQSRRNKDGKRTGIRKEKMSKPYGTKEEISQIINRDTVHYCAHCHSVCRGNREDAPVSLYSILKDWVES